MDIDREEFESLRGHSFSRMCITSNWIDMAVCPPTLRAGGIV
jgi:hypothetical protein